jgi:hypothetical protein
MAPYQRPIGSLCQALLLQVATTNPVETWHLRIQYGTSKGSKSKQSFKGCCITLDEKATQLDTETEAAAST